MAFNEELGFSLKGEAVGVRVSSQIFVYDPPMQFTLELYHGLQFADQSSLRLLFMVVVVIDCCRGLSGSLASPSVLGLWFWPSGCPPLWDISPAFDIVSPAPVLFFSFGSVYLSKRKPPVQLEIGE